MITTGDNLPKSKPVLIRIEAAHFTAGIDWPTRYAPILKYMRGWSLEKIAGYCKSKGWKFQALENGEQNDT